MLISERIAMKITVDQGQFGFFYYVKIRDGNTVIDIQLDEGERDGFARELAWAAYTISRAELVRFVSVYLMPQEREPAKEQERDVWHNKADAIAEAQSCLRSYYISQGKGIQESRDMANAIVKALI
jgi:hypothetical protein